MNENKIREDVIRLFSKHEITYRDSHTVVMHVPSRGSEYSVELHASRLGYLVFTGDLQSVIFGRKFEKNIYNMISWIGSCKGVDSYLVEKARTGGTVAEEYSEEAANSLIIDLKSDYARDSKIWNDLERLRLSDYINCEEDFIHELSLIIPDAWELASSTMVPCSRVWHAWAACRRALELLKTVKE